MEALYGEMVSLLCVSSTILLLKIQLLILVRNRGELAEGWYQPQMFAKAEAFVAGSPPTGKSAPDHPYDKTHDSVQTESSDDDLPGPTLADVPNLDAYPNKRSGPSIPNLQDLELRQGRLPPSPRQNSRLIHWNRGRSRKCPRKP